MPVWTEQDWDKAGYVNGQREHLFVKPHPNGRCCGNTFTLFNFKRPHGRAFHVAWFAFFMCFISWFAIPSLLTTLKKPKCESAEFCESCLVVSGERFMAVFQAKNKTLPATFPAAGDDDRVLVEKDGFCGKCFPAAQGKGRGCGGLGLSNDQALVSNIMNFSGTVLVRVLIGPLADQLGVRVTFSMLLLLFSIPGFMATTVTSYQGFLVVRFFISFIGGSFVLTQIWTTLMFHSKVVGLANATSAGWGNLGGGAANAIQGNVFQALHKSGFSNDQAWRRTLAWPPAVLVAVGAFAYFFTDDCPYGRNSDLKKKDAHTEMQQMVAKRAEEEAAAVEAGAEPANVAVRSLKQAAANWKTWVLFLLYASSFGVELIVHSQLPLYFNQAFSFSQADAGMAAALFGVCNIFARSCGGWISDSLNTKFGLRGRLWALFGMTVYMGCMKLTFASLTYATAGQGGALAVLFAWGCGVMMVEGAVFAIVPFVDPKAVGGVAGIVGAGGTLGALGGLFVVRALAVRPALMALGYVAASSAFLVPLLWLPGAGSMFRAEEEVSGPECSTPPVDSARNLKPEAPGPAATAARQAATQPELVLCWTPSTPPPGMAWPMYYRGPAMMPPYGMPVMQGMA